LKINFRDTTILHVVLRNHNMPLSCKWPAIVAHVKEQDNQ
jgi:hypothetical protein